MLMGSLKGPKPSVKEVLSGKLLLTFMIFFIPTATIIKTGINLKKLFDMVIIPFLVGLKSRAYAAIFVFCFGVIPPIPILGRSLL